MKIFSFIFVLILSIPWNHEESLKDSEFDWLLGSWQRNNDRPGRVTYEHWTKISGTEYHGLGCTLRKGDTIFKEEIKLFKRDNQWIYEVSGVNEDPTPFKITKISKRSFSCENKGNEFPKFIDYSLEDDTLLARIYGGGAEVLFDFSRLKP